MRIEVKSTAVVIKKGTAKVSGRPFEIPEQEVWAEFNEERRRVKVPLQDGQPPYAPGVYALSDASFIVNQFGSFEIGRVVLVPVKG